MTLALAEESLGRWVQLVGPAATLAERIAGTEFVPGAMRGKPDVVLAAILYGDEIGVGPMQALAGIHIIDGRPQPSAELARALILRAGHRIDVHEMSGSKVRISGLRRGDPETARVAVEWTSDMARAAGLLGRQNWQRYPRAMLLARATGDLARQVFPDVVKGLGYVAEEQADDLDRWAAPEIAEETKAPPRKRVARAQRPKIPELPATELPEAPRMAPAASPPIDPWAEPDEESAPPIAPPMTPAPASNRPPPASQDQALLPELEPEPQAPEPSLEPPASVLVGPGMIRGLQATLGRILKEQAGDRDLRLELVSAIAGRRILTTKELTKDEAMNVTQTLMRIENGEMTWIRTEHGIALVEELPDDEP